jgi:hypothetical protein
MCATADGSSISPITGTLDRYIFTCDCRYELGLAWGIDFRYIDPNNRVRFDFAPGAPNQVNVLVYAGGSMVLHPYAGTCSHFGSSYNQYYCKFEADRNHYRVYFGSDPNNLEELCDFVYAFDSGTIRYQAWGYSVHSCFDNVLITTIPDAVEAMQDFHQPISYTLYPPYPNPFNPQTKLTFVVPAPSDVSLLVYDACGRKVATVFKGHCHAGTYEAIFNAFDLAGGVYFAQFKACSYMQTQKMILLK